MRLRRGFEVVALALIALLGAVGFVFFDVVLFLRHMWCNSPKDFESESQRIIACQLPRLLEVICAVVVVAAIGRGLWVLLRGRT